MQLFGDLEQFGDSPALFEEGKENVSFSELVSHVDDLGTTLGNRSLVVCLCSNTIDSVIGYVGFQRAGHVCLMLSAKIDQQRLTELCRQFEPQYIWAPKSRGLSQGVTSIHEFGDYELVETGGIPQRLNSALAILMPTSGSTGSPMMVRQSTANLIANGKSIVESLSLSNRDRALTTLPMNYTYGLSIINTQLMVGGSLLMSEATVMDRAFWDDATKGGVTYFGGVPYTYEMLARLGVQRLRGSDIRMLTQAGGKLSSELVMRLAVECQDIGVDFVVMYGQTEATARMSVLQPSEVLQRPDSIGRPIPGGEFRILDLEHGQDLAVGEIGELEYRGENVAMGYAQSSSDLDRGDDFGGRILTGDLAKQDEQGFFYIVGRRKRFVKLFGNRVSLDHVESHVRDLGIENACAGVDDLLRIHVLPGHDRIRLAEMVASFVGVHKKAIEVVEVDSIPRSEAGKILYSELDRS